MELEAAVKGMMDTRAKLRSKDGVTDPNFISEQMQRLAQYTGAVEEHLGALEEQIEIQENKAFVHYSKEEGRSVAQASQLAKQDVSATKGQIAKLKRYCSGSWQIVSVSQSRWNHLAKGQAGQI